jgi:hypothetical protein
MLYDAVIPTIREKKLASNLSVLILTAFVAACGNGDGSFPVNVSTKAAATPATVTPVLTSGASSNDLNVPDTSASTPPTIVPAATTPVSVAPATTSSTPSPAVAPGLYISEIAANYRRTSGVSWFEVFNNSTKPIALSDYQLRATGWNIATQEVSATPVLFDLPQVNVPAGGYMVIAGKTATFLTNTDKSVYITATPPTTGKSPGKTYAPYWSDTEGFVELLKKNNSQTTDFVRFGTSTIAPTTGTAWIGDNVPAFPAKPNYVTVSTPDPLDTHDGSIVRLSNAFLVSATKSDWSSVAFSTPGGQNDVLTSAVDSDHDGIPDSAKIAGGTYGGMDLYSLGARKGQQDVFIHVNYMTKAGDLGTTPQKNALQQVVDAFNGHNIKIHFDAGNLYTPSTDATNFNLSGDVSHAVTYSKCTQLLNAANGFAPDAGCTSIYQYSSGSFDVRRKPIYRYMQVANSQLANGTAGSSGIAELPGTKFLLTLGSWGLKSTDVQSKSQLEHYQAATIMHEFGHTLNLHHGGFEDQNYKPNYFSIMNYMYQLPGLPSQANGTGANERYYQYLNWFSGTAIPGHAKSYTYSQCDVPEGPCSAVMKIDYSNGSGTNLDEANLLESDNIGRGSLNKAYLDWNLNGKLDGKSYAYDWINGHTVMRDFNDWSNIKLEPNPHDVTAQALAATAGVRFVAKKQLDVGRTFGEVALEEAPPAHFVNATSSQ